MLKRNFDSKKVGISIKSSANRSFKLNPYILSSCNRIIIVSLQRITHIALSMRQLARKQQKSKV